MAAKTGTSKVNQARRRKGVHIVTPAWLDDSVALWQREPEEHYKLALDTQDSQESDVPTPSSFPDSPSREPPDVGVDGEVGDEIEPNASLHVDWGDAAAEIEALLDETDDDEDGLVSGSNTADESDADSTASGPAGGSRKRPRASPRSRTSSTDPTGTGESPLAKRRKVAAARAGQSKLKMSESIDAVDMGTTVSSTTGSSTSSPTMRSKDGDADGSASSDEDLDDFAKALEGELS